MYWEALGFKGSPSTDRVEGLARWVQWAEASLMAGNAENEGKTRYNLSEFWAQKKAAIEDGATQAELNDFNILDIRAHGLLAAMDDGLIWSKSPSFWGFYRSAISGGKPDRPDTEALKAEAREAATLAKQGAVLAGNQRMAQYFSEMATAVDSNAKQADEFWAQPGLKIAGVPLWAWGIGAIAILILLRRR